MTYATADAFNALFGTSELIALTDRAANTAVNSQVADRAFADADAEIHSYLATVYDVPVDPAPRLLVRVACDVARYRLYAAAPTDEVRTRYTDALKWLKAVAAGDAILVGDDGIPLPLSSTPAPSAGVAGGSRTLALGAGFQSAYTFPQHTFTSVLE